MAKCKRRLEDEVEGCLHGLSSILLQLLLLESCKRIQMFPKMVTSAKLNSCPFTTQQPAKTPIKISNIRKVRSREDSSNVNVLVNAKSQLNVVRILTFQYHADDSIDVGNKNLADILHIPNKTKNNRR